MSFSRNFNFILMEISFGWRFWIEFLSGKIVRTVFFARVVTVRDVNVLVFADIEENVPLPATSD